MVVYRWNYCHHEEEPCSLLLVFCLKNSLDITPMNVSGVVVKQTRYACRNKMFVSRQWFIV